MIILKKDLEYKIAGSGPFDGFGYRDTIYFRDLKDQEKLIFINSCPVTVYTNWFE